MLPLYFVAAGLDVRQIGWLAGIYPAVWGASQLATGALSDRLGRKWIIASGLWVQAAGTLLVVAAGGWNAWVWASVLLGVGTAMVYPTLSAAVSDVAPAETRASALGVYRLWRDLGYAAGALLSGALADWLGAGAAIGVVAALTFLSGCVVAIMMYETLAERRTAM